MGNTNALWLNVVCCEHNQINGSTCLSRHLYNIMKSYIFGFSWKKIVTIFALNQFHTRKLTATLETLPDFNLAINTVNILSTSISILIVKYLVRNFVTSWLHTTLLYLHCTSYELNITLRTVKEQDLSFIFDYHIMVVCFVFNSVKYIRAAFYITLSQYRNFENV